MNQTIELHASEHAVRQHGVQATFAIDKAISIGRHEINEIRITGQKSHFYCNQVHARLAPDLRKEHGLVVHDLRSHLGTYYRKSEDDMWNELEDEEISLEEGALLAFGKPRNTPYMFRVGKTRKQQPPETGQMDDARLKDELECAICNELMVEPVALDPCGHCFCSHCIKTWLKTTQACPTCRKSVKKSPTPVHQLKRIIETIAVSRLTREERITRLDHQSKTVDARVDTLREERIMAVIKVRTPYNMTIHHFSSVFEDEDDEDEEEDEDDEEYENYTV